MRGKRVKHLRRAAFVLSEAAKQAGIKVFGQTPDTRYYLRGLKRWYRGANRPAVRRYVAHILKEG